MTIHELSDASNIIYEEAGDEANIILGCVIDKSLSDEFRVTVIATGINKEKPLEIDRENRLNELELEKPHVYASSLDDEYKDALPTYKRKQHEEKVLEPAKNKELVQQPIHVFGDDDYEVPAYLRSRRQG